MRLKQRSLYGILGRGQMLRLRLIIACVILIIYSVPAFPYENQSSKATNKESIPEFDLEEVIAEARAELRKGPEVHENIPLDAIYFCCKLKNNLDRAVKEFKEIEEELRQTQPWTAGNAHLLAIMSLVDMGKQEEALKEMERFREISRRYNLKRHFLTSQVRFEVGRGYENQGNIAKAIEYYEKAEPVSLSHGTYNVSLRLGICYWKQGKSEDALKQLDEKIIRTFDEEPTRAGRKVAAEAIYVSGQIFEETGKPDAAKSAYEKVVARYSDQKQWVSKANEKLATVN